LWCCFALPCVAAEPRFGRRSRRVPDTPLERLLAAIAADPNAGAWKLWADMLAGRPAQKPKRRLSRASAGRRDSN
jgi:hypothetical protein